MQSSLTRLCTLCTQYKAAPRYSRLRDALAGEMAVIAASLNHYPLPGTLAIPTVRYPKPRKLRQSSKRKSRPAKRRRISARKVKP
jgi:hypothetical protein